MLTIANHVGSMSGPNHESTASRCMKKPKVGWNEFKCFFDRMYSPRKSVEMTWRWICLKEARSNESVSHISFLVRVGWEGETAHTGGA